MHKKYGWTGSLAAVATVGVLTGCMGGNHGGTLAGAPGGIADAPAVVPATMAAASEGKAVAAATPVSAHDKAGFYTELDSKDGRLWVFRADSDDLAKFKTEGKPAKQVLRPGAGPEGITLKSTESSTIVEYVATKPGFHVELDSKDERLWVFKADSDDLAKFKTEGKPAKQVLRPGVGPLGLTLKSTESDTIVEYVATQPGFHIELDSKDGRLWVFKEGSADLEAFRTEGKPAKQVLRPAAGPLGLTLKSTESDVLDAYQAAF